MNKEEAYQVGYILKTRGLQGEVVLFLDVDEPENYQELDAVFLELDNQLVPFLLAFIRLNGKKATVRFEEIDHIDDAKPLVGARAWLPLQVLPDLPEGAFYYHQIIGYQVVDSQQGVLGKVVSIYDQANQDFIAMSYQGKEVLIPVAGDIVQTADHQARTLSVHLPEGLIDIYLEE